jgi:hypothetical protein
VSRSGRVAAEFAPGRSTEAAVITKAHGATLPLPGK